MQIFALAGERNYVGNDWVYSENPPNARRSVRSHLRAWCARHETVLPRLSAVHTARTVLRTNRQTPNGFCDLDGDATRPLPVSHGKRSRRSDNWLEMHTHTKNMHAPRVLLPRATASTMARHGPESLRAQAQTHTHTHSTDRYTHTYSCLRARHDHGFLLCSRA